MAQEDSLHQTSLQLVGKLSEASSSQQHPMDGPWDEVQLDTSMDEITTHMNTSTSSMPDNMTTTTEQSLIDLDKLSAGPDEARWRAHGLAKRQRLLEDDQRKGGRTFHVSFGDTSVHRYFSVAHWALEQFHELYQNENGNLEETYVMGYRIVSFLTECLPKHPGFASAPDIRRRAKVELDLLKECLEDVALQIDEETCNTFVDDFDPLFVVGDDDDDSVTESSSSGAVSSQASSLKTQIVVSSPEKKSRMVRFENWEELQAEMEEHPSDEYRKSLESPTTVRTTDTSITEPMDTSYLSTSSDSDSPAAPRRTHEAVERLGRVELDMGVEDPHDHDVGGENDAAFPSLHKHYFYRQVHLDFLEQIASEEVPFETDSDSDAADSWEQSPDDQKDYLAPSSSGAAPTCDPARIAFRDMMNRLPSQLIVQDMKRHRESRRNTDRQVHGQEIENEIRQYLESSQDEIDETQFVESCHERMQDKRDPSNSSSWNVPSKTTAEPAIPSSSSRSSFSSLSGSSFSESSSSKTPTSHHPEQSSAFRPFTRQPSTRTTSRKSLFEKNFLDDDDWISFDNSASNKGVSNFFALD